MELCLYCGEPVTLLQRWKLGKARGAFCSREHEDAHADLQQQAARRLMPKAAEDPPAAIAEPEWKWTALAPPALAVNPHESPQRSAVGFVFPLEVPWRPVKPLTKFSRARMALAEYDFPRIAPAQIDPAEWRISDVPFPVSDGFASARMLTHGGSDARLELRSVERCETLRFPSEWFARRAPDLHPLSSIAPTLLPGHAHGICAGKIRETGPLPIETAPSPGPIANRSSVAVMEWPGCELWTELSLNRGVLQLEAACAIERQDWIRPAAPCPVFTREEQSWDDRLSPARLPIGCLEFGVRCLRLAGGGELRQPRPAPVETTIRTLEPSPCFGRWDAPRLPRTVALEPELRWSIHVPVDLGAADFTLSRHGNVRALPSVAKTLYPLLASAQAVPAFRMDLTGPPLGPDAADCILTAPAQLLALKRGSIKFARDNSERRGAGRIPAFQQIRMQPLCAWPEPIFSLNPLRTKQVVAFAGRPSRKVADRRIAW